MDANAISFFKNHFKLVSSDLKTVIFHSQKFVSIQFIIFINQCSFN